MSPPVGEVIVKWIQLQFWKLLDRYRPVFGVDLRRMRDDVPITEEERRNICLPTSRSGLYAPQIVAGPA